MKKKIIITLITIVLLGFGFEYYLWRTYNINIHQFFFTKMYKKTDLSEHLFSCTDAERNSYNKFVQIGKERMRNQTVVIAGLARNCAKNLPATIERIELTGKAFKDYRVVIFENDSADGTRDVIKAWAAHNNRVILLDCTNAPDCKFGHQPLYNFGLMGTGRISKMAAFRNTYLELIKQYFSSYDYLMVVDIDLQGPWSLNGVMNSIGHDNWDAICAYGLMTLIGTWGTVFMMYDALAYVGKQDETGPTMSPFDLMRHYLRINFWDTFGVNECTGLVPVKSGFGGLAIYKMPAIQNAWYSGGICEHIAFHEHMAHNGYDKIFMNPALVILSGHQGPPNFLDVFLIKAH